MVSYLALYHMRYSLWLLLGICGNLLFTAELCMRYNLYMSSVIWFLLGLFVGLACDYLLVKAMIKPLIKRISDLESRNI